MSSKNKTCGVCRQDKPLSSFHRQGARGRHSYCADCFNARYRGARRRATERAQKREQNLKTRYRIDGATFDAMLASQEGLCAICQQPSDRMVVDHDHATGKVRGLLCHACNLALPHVEREGFRAAALRYLEAYR